MDTKTSGKLSLKTNFAPKHNWEPFYTGGSVVAFDEGRSLLCSCGDAIKIVDVASGTVQATLSQEGDDVTCIGCSPDDSFIVSATKSMLLKQWKIENDSTECVRTWKAIHATPVLCMDFDPTSTLLATGSSDSTIKIWDMINQYCTHNLRGSQGLITVVKFHPVDLKLFSASNDYVIRVWDLQNSRCICMLDNHVSAVTSLAFDFQSDKTAFLLSAGRDSLISVWDVNNISETNTNIKPTRSIPVYESLEQIKIPSKDDLVKLIDSVDENAIYALSAGASGVLKLWDLKTGKCVYQHKESGDNSQQPAITDLMYLKHFEKYATVTFDHNINIFQLKNGLVADKHLVGYNDEVLDVKFVGSGDSHVAVVTNSPFVKVFELKSSSCQLLSGHQDTVLCLDAFKDGLMFASGSKDNSVRLWRMNSETSVVTEIAVGRSHTHDVTALATSKLNSNFIASGSRDFTLKIWEIVTNVTEDSSVTNLKVRHTNKAHDKDINSVAIAPNDKFIATGSQDRTAKLWNVSDGELLGVFHGHKRGIWSCQFSPSDQVLGTSSADGTIKLWSISDFTCLKTMEGHDCSILNMIFISKGAQIITSGSDGLMKLWNIKSSECVKTFDGHDDKIWGLTVNSDDNAIVSAAADSKMILWEDVTEKERDEAKQEQETTVLRQQELNNLIHEKKFAKALRLAITLEQPFTALKVLKEMKWEKNAEEAIGTALSKLRNDQKDTLLKFVMSWNTNSRNCHEAQLVLNHILRLTHPEDFMKFSNAQAAIEALIPYTDRHYQRMSRLLMSTTFVDYVWQMMKLKPVSIPAEEENSISTEGAKIFRSTAGSIHPLKYSHATEPLKQRKRTRKPDLVDPFSEIVDDVSESKDVDNDDKTIENLISPPKRMRLRSAAKSKVKKTVEHDKKRRTTSKK